MKSFLDGLKALGRVKLAAMGAIGAAVLALITLLAVSATSAPMAMLYGGLSLQDSANVVGALQAAHIPYALESGGQTVLVPQPDVDSARLLLAQKNLPAGGSAGYELFDHQNALTGSDFLDNINETRALDGELERTIQLIRGVQAARVQVVLPRLEPFAQNPDPAQASVLLTLSEPQVLDQESVNAILNLVASAVPGLKPDHISIADDRGDLLASAGRPGDTTAGAAGEDAIRQQAELRLAAAVESLLGQALGPGHVHVVAAVTMNFDAVDQTSQTYDPNSQVAVSTQNSTSASQNTTAQQGVTVQNNLPNPGAASAPQPGSSSTQKTQTTNYDISLTTRHLVQSAPSIGSISLAVLVDEQPSTDTKGKTSWQPRTPAQLAAITALAKSAIGFNAARGDSVQVESLTFASDMRPALRPLSLVARFLNAADINSLIRLLVFAIAALVALLAVLRPTMLRIATIGTGAGGAVLAGGGGSALPGATGLTSLPPPGADTPAEPMIDLSHIEGQMRAASIRRIADLSEKSPEETLALIRTWLNQDRSAEAR